MGRGNGKVPWHLWLTHFQIWDVTEVRGRGAGKGKGGRERCGVCGGGGGLSHPWGGVTKVLSIASFFPLHRDKSVVGRQALGHRVGALRTCWKKVTTEPSQLPAAHIPNMYKTIRKGLSLSLLCWLQACHGPHSAFQVLTWGARMKSSRVREGGERKWLEMPQEWE